MHLGRGSNQAGPTSLPTLKKKKLKSLSFPIRRTTDIMSGMVLHWLTSLKASTKYHCASVSVKDSSISSAFPRYDLKLSRRKVVKKIQAVKSLKKLKEFFSQQNTRVVFQDEVHFTVEATITRQWFPKGSCPKVKSYPGRKSVAYSGFVTYGSGELFVSKPSWFNYETTIASIKEFIAQIKQRDNERIVLVMDNGKAGIYNRVGGFG